MLAVEGDVVVESPGVRVRLAGAGSTLVAHVEGLPSLAIMRRMRSLAPVVRRCVPLLVRFGLTVDVVVGSLRIARAGAGIDANRVARALGFEHVRIGK